MAEVWIVTTGWYPDRWPPGSDAAGPAGIMLVFDNEAGARSTADAIDEARRGVISARQHHFAYAPNGTLELVGEFTTLQGPVPVLS